VPIFALLGYVVQRTLCRRASTATLHDAARHLRLSVVIENLLLEILHRQRTVDQHRLTDRESWQVNNTIYVSYLSLTVLIVSVVVLAALQLFLSKTSTADRSRVSDDVRRPTLRHQLPAHLRVARPWRSPRWRCGDRLWNVHEPFAHRRGVNLLFAFETVVIGESVRCGNAHRWNPPGDRQQFGAHFNEQYTVLAGNVLFLLVLAIRLRVSSQEGGHVVSVDDLTPVDQSITVKRHQIPVAYTSLARLSWWSFSRGRRGSSGLGRLDPDEFLHPRDHGDDVEPARRVRRDVSIGQQAFIGLALTPPSTSPSREWTLRRNSARGDHLRRHRVPGDVSTFSPPRGILLRRNVGGRRQRHVGHRFDRLLRRRYRSLLPGLSSIAFTQLNHDTYLAAWFVPS